MMYKTKLAVFAVIALLFACTMGVPAEAKMAVHPLLTRYSAPFRMHVGFYRDLPVTRDAKKVEIHMGEGKSVTLVTAAEGRLLGYTYIKQGMLFVSTTNDEGDGKLPGGNR